MGGRLSCLARNGGVAARGRKLNDDIAAGNRGAAGLRLDQAINETEWCELPEQRTPRRIGDHHWPATSNPGEWQSPALLHHYPYSPNSTPANPALAASDASAEAQPGPSEPPAALLDQVRRIRTDIRSDQIVEAKNAAQISSGRARNYDTAGLLCPVLRARGLQTVPRLWRRRRWNSSRRRFPRQRSDDRVRLKAVCGLIAGERGRYGKSQSDSNAENWRA